jgi:hypothetical protein
MASVGAAFGSPNAKASFGKIQTYTPLLSYPVKRNPLDKFHMDTALQYQIFQQSADRIIWYRGYNCRSFVKTAAQSPCDIVFSAAFPDFKFSCRMNPVIAGVKTNHHLAQRKNIISAIRSESESKR